jgi:hypothetical protein
MPGDDGVRPDDDEILAPPREPAKNETPEGAVPQHQGRTGWLRPDENAGLMAEGKVLSDEGRPGTEKSAEGSESEPNEPERAARIRSGGGRRR